MTNTSKHFIYVFDKETAEYLSGRGYALLKERDGTYVFIGGNELTFDELPENMELFYSDVLSF